MTDIFKKSVPFLIMCGVYWLVCAYILLFMPKGAVELYINAHTSSIADLYFKYATFMGDGTLHALLLLIMLFISPKYFWPGLISALLIAIISPVCKHLLFPDALRPIEYFKGISLHLVSGVKMAHYNSFPSGHSMTGFAWAMWLAIYVNKRYATVLFFMLAISVTLSRVYLLQHFIGDTLAGSVIGIVCTYVSFYLYLSVAELIAKRRGNRIPV